MLTVLVDFIECLGWHPHFHPSKECRHLRRRVIALGMLAIVASIYDLGAAVLAALRIDDRIQPMIGTGPALSLPVILSFLFLFEFFHYFSLFYSEFSDFWSRFNSELKAEIEENRLKIPKSETAEWQKVLRNLEKIIGRSARLQSIMGVVRFFNDVLFPGALGFFVVYESGQSLVEVFVFVLYALV